MSVIVFLGTMAMEWHVMTKTNASWTSTTAAIMQYVEMALAITIAFAFLDSVEMDGLVMISMNATQLITIAAIMQIVLMI